jgi:hypothetical protein
MGTAAAQSLAPNFTIRQAGLVMALALVAEIMVAGIFVLLGALARKGLKWAFILGMVFYALDGIIWLAFGEYLPAGFHLLGLYGLYTGVRALGHNQSRQVQRGGFFTSRAGLGHR